MLYQLSEVDRLLDGGPGLFVRCSAGFASDIEDGSVDAESGLALPGLPAHSLDPEAWWTLPRLEWVARQLSRLPAPRHVPQDGSRPERFAWLLRGRGVGRAPDGGVLVADVEVVGRLAECLIDQADHVWGARLEADAGRRETELVSVVDA